MTLAQYMDQNDYKEVQKVVSGLTEGLQKILQALKTDPLENNRKKREISEQYGWSDLADVVEDIIRFLLEAKNVEQWYVIVMISHFYVS